MFGLVTKRQHEQLRESLTREIESYKAEFAKAVPGWLLKTAEAEHWNMPDPSVYGAQSDLYRRVSWIVAACEAVADVAAPVKFNVKRKVGEDERDIPNHPFELLLEKPNPLDSRSELIKATIMSWMLTGNSYWWLNTTDETMPPTEIWHIPSHKIIPNPDGNLYLKDYLYYPGNGDELHFQTWEIVHFRRYNPFSRFIGLSAVESIALTAFGDQGMASWNAKLFKENNGRLPGMIMFENWIGDDVWNQIKEDMDEAARKRTFMLLRGVGQGKANWVQNAVSQREMEYLEGRKANRDEIWNVLAKGLVSYLSELSGKASSRTGESAFERLSVFPKLDEMGQKITNEVLNRYVGRKLVGKFEDMRTVDQTMELEKQKAYENSHTVGEVRKEWYGDGEFGDERDNMSVDQFRRNSSTVVYEPPTKTPPLQFAQNSTDLIDQSNPDNPDSQDLSQQSFEKVVGKSDFVLDLDRFQRKALKSVGKDVVFESEYISDETLEFLHLQLPMCVTDKAVKSLFKQIKSEVRKRKPKQERLALADSVNRLAEALMIGVKE